MFPLLVSVAVFLGGSLLVSNYSGERYRTIETHLARLRENVAELEGRQSALLAEAEAYRTSRDAISVAARSLLFYEPGVQVIRVEGLDDPLSTRSPGTIIKRSAVDVEYAAYVRAAALIAFVLTLLIELLYRVGSACDRQTMRRASR